MQKIYGEDDGLYLEEEDVYNEPYFDQKTGEKVLPSNIYVIYQGKMKSGEITVPFDEYLTDEIKNKKLSMIITDTDDEEESEEEDIVEEDIEKEATSVSSVGQFKRGNIESSNSMSRDEYLKWMNIDFNEDRRDPDMITESDDSLLTYIKNGIGTDINSINDDDGLIQFIKDKLKDDDSDENDNSNSNSLPKYLPKKNITNQNNQNNSEEDDNEDNNTVTQNNDNQSNDEISAVTEYNGGVKVKHSKLYEEEQQTNLQNNEQTNMQNNEQANEQEQNTPAVDIVKEVTPQGIKTSIGNEFGASEIFKGERDYNVVFANGVSQDQMQKIVNKLSNYHVYPSYPNNGKYYQVLISNSASNPISGKRECLKRIFKLNKLNENKANTKGTDEYILKNAFRKGLCLDSIFELYIKDSGDSQLKDYWNFNIVNKKEENTMKYNSKTRTRKRRVNECFGFGMTLNILKDETGIADTDELLGKIDEFMADGNCNPFDSEECRTEFINYVNCPCTETPCDTCGDIGSICIDPNFETDEFYTGDELPNVDDDIDLSLNDTIEDDMDDEEEVDFAKALNDELEDLPDVDDDEDLSLDDTIEDNDEEVDIDKELESYRRRFTSKRRR